MRKVAVILNLDERELFQLKYQGTPLERHLGSPTGKAKARQTNAEQELTRMFQDNNVSDARRKTIVNTIRFVLDQLDEEGRP